MRLPRNPSRNRIYGWLVAPLALVVIAYPATLASASPSGHRAARKHRHRRTRTRTIHVRCAAINVICRETAGAHGLHGGSGLNGANGANGANGTNGANSAPIVDRARTKASQMTQSCNTHAACPDQFDDMNGRTWIAGAGEDDHFSGLITFTPPGMCSSSNSFFPPGLQVTVYVNGNQVGSYSDFGNFVGAAQQTQRINFSGTPFSSTGYGSDGDIPPSGSPENRTITVNIGDACNSSNTHYTVNSISIDVGGVS